MTERKYCLLKELEGWLDQLENNKGLTERELFRLRHLIGLLVFEEEI